jgi:hypothetical protein
MPTNLPRLAEQVFKRFEIPPLDCQNSEIQGFSSRYVASNAEATKSILSLKLLSERSYL